MEIVRPDVTVLDRVKIQAEVLVPLVKRLEAELGKGEAHRLVREGLGERYRERARQMAAQVPVRTMVGTPFLDRVFADALEYETIEDTEEVVAFNVKECAFARFFRELGEPDLGFLLVCSNDYSLAEGAGIELDRTGTIMQGADHCDFRWRLMTPST